MDELWLCWVFDDGPQIACAAAIVALLYATVAQGFDYSRYPTTDLNGLVEQPRPEVRQQIAQKSPEVIERAPEKRAPKQPATGSSAAAANLRGEWLRNGPGFACKVTPPQGKLPPEAINPETLANACLRMGPLGIGGDAKSVASVLGPPHRTLPQPNDATALIYFLEAAERLPYFAATVQKDKIVVLQVSGAATAKDYTFNHIKLGDGTDTLVKHFGPAKQVKPSGLKNTDLWDYPPWPFSFEVTNGRVTSVRINAPAYQQ